MSSKVLSEKMSEIVYKCSSEFEIKHDTYVAEKAALVAQIAAFNALPVYSPVRKTAFQEIQKASKRFTANSYKNVKENEKSLLLLLDIARSEFPEHFESVVAETAPALKAIQEQVAVWRKLASK